MKYLVVEYYLYIFASTHSLTVFKFRTKNGKSNKKYHNGEVWGSSKTS